MNVLVTGALGYVGGRLVPRLLERGHRVRVLVRDPARVRERAWASEVEIVHADLLQPETVSAGLEGLDVAYYLVHSMHAGSDFERYDREAVESFCRLASSARHVIYLGGLLPRRKGAGERSVSRHLLSRAEMGRTLARSFPLTELRAGPIIGSGSASFEMLRYITERFPLVLAPAWVKNRVQPIAIRDVLTYLLLALERGPCGVVEIGSDALSYREMVLAYAELCGLRRLLIPLPRYISVQLSARAIGLFTPIPRTLAAPLIEGMERPLRAQRFRARHYFPEVQPLSYRSAVELALQRIERRAVETRWSGARAPETGSAYQDVEGLIRDSRTVRISARPETVFRALSEVGGERGWPAWNWVYRLRAWIDRLLGGPGLQRGRPRPGPLSTGDAIDFWKVDAVSSPRLLRLCADLEFPGRTWLEWRVRSVREVTYLTQNATFGPKGLRGALNWYALFPLHRLFFGRTLRALAKAATHMERIEASLRGKPGPPYATKGLFGDVRNFFLRRPRPATLIEFRSQAEREDYSQRIMQRLDINVSTYSVLNLHRIGVDAPVHSVFEELMRWDGHSSCWPNHVARVERVEGELERIEIRPLGLRRAPFGAGSRLGWDISPLFILQARMIRHQPDPLGPDNARYMLYTCSGGYPIGIFTIYVRSAVPERGEVERTQVFFGVGFDFYGKESLSRFRPLTKVWEGVHNRVTTNVLHRFKRLCEWRFQRMQDGS